MACLVVDGEALHPTAAAVDTFESRFIYTVHAIAINSMHGQCILPEVQMVFASFLMCQQTDTRRYDREEHRFGGMRTSPPFSVITINLRAHRTPVGHARNVRSASQCLSADHWYWHMEHAKENRIMRVKFLFAHKQWAQLLLL